MVIAAPDQTAARMRRRQRNELLRKLASPQHVSEAALGLDDATSQTPSQSTDEDFNGVGVALEILGIEVLGDFKLRHDASPLMGEIREQLVFLRRH